MQPPPAQYNYAPPAPAAPHPGAHPYAAQWAAYYAGGDDHAAKRQREAYAAPLAAGQMHASDGSTVNIPDPSRYKKKLCRNHQEGHCKFAEKCLFAHGEADIRH